ncbi:MAG TPA: hypothetical protein VHQ41_00890 [Patescibacteria group bacterium]|jgi:hypothetical protein|nr:hypothetical protein [Patescibacteria group bacterium]
MSLLSRILNDLNARKGLKIHNIEREQLSFEKTMGKDAWKLGYPCDWVTIIVYPKRSIYNVEGLNKLLYGLIPPNEVQKPYVQEFSDSKLYHDDFVMGTLKFIENFGTFTQKFDLTDSDVTIETGSRIKVRTLKREITIRLYPDSTITRIIHDDFFCKELDGPVRHPKSSLVFTPDLKYSFHTSDVKKLDKLSQKRRRKKQGVRSEVPV